ncbi:2Fe-2S iron-sulfur cluster-binding protein [Paenarthrobacter nitroguajacolicus]|uniref:2Fe-2S iron-sulfur cluster-binding protein n=1 Tax=Paenarthrobacter nitroguajacolicus TaxID=211146 RepID=UPI00248B9609|nr:2Fe-2S iron-sulfur cluster-binding protein [Paenarthrobacter nitroguajacolicus]MDI2035894.1 Putidaredoxin [Paenarthrobacter nitroguajacolicus]
MSNAKMHLADGGVQEIEVADGESIMRAAVREGVPGIEGECGGEMSCATCHVYLPSPWKEKIRGASDDERDLLEADEDATEDSRLSCQVRMRPEIDGVELTVVNAE